MSIFYLHKTPLIIQYLYPLLKWSGKKDRTIYLTFDDGPVPGITEFVLEELQSFGVSATFFCVGHNIHKHPEIFKKITSQGHAVGNHTFNHLNGLKTNTKDYSENIKKCEKEIISGGYLRISKLFRPPYGLIKISQIKQIVKHYQIIMWDVLSGDFDPNLKPEDCLKKSIKYTGNGSIIVFHDNKKAEPRLKYVLPRYLQHFKELGFKFKSL